MESSSLHNFLFKVVGEDPQLLNKCDDETIKKKFIFSGIIVLIIFIISFISFFFAFQQIFAKDFLPFLLSVFVSFMLYNIYKLNLITLSPNRLTYSFGYIFSLFIRLMFFIIIGMAIIKPVETIVYNAVVELLAENHQYNNEVLLGNNEVLLGNDEGYFVSKMQLFNKEHPSVWVFTLLFLGLFTTPFFIKFFINPSNSYSRSKIVLNEKIIEEDYELFKQKYPQQFMFSIQQKIVLEELYEDPPYNTIKKKDERKIGKVEDFIKHLYGV
jgi:hypothetical protein